MTKPIEAVISKLVPFKPKQKFLNVDGRKVEVLDYVGRNAVRYVFDSSSKKILKVCLDCNKHTEVLELDKESWKFVDIHDEIDVHFQGKSGFKSRCVKCDRIFENERLQKERDTWFETFLKEGLFEEQKESGITLGSLPKENREFIQVISLKLKMTEVEFLNYIIDVYKRHNRYVPVQFEEIMK